MRPNILLVQPPFFGLEKGKGKPSLPLALVYAAALVPAEVPVTLFDRRLRPAEQLVAWCRAHQPLCVGLTAVSGTQARAAAETARLLRERQIGPLVWGGKHATLFGNDLVAAGLADYAVIGDGERTFAELVRVLAAGSSPAAIPGLWLNGPDGVCRTAEPQPFLLEKISRLPFDLLTHDYLYPKNGRPTGVLESSRGCPGRCTYCYLSTRDKPFWHGAPAPWVIARVAELRARYPRLRHVDFVDDNFFAEHRRALAIAELLSAEQGDLGWTCNGGRLRDMAAFTDAELAFLARSGLDRVDIGVETGSPRMARLLNKEEPPGAVRDVVQRLLRAGIRPWINLLAGLPGETAEDLAQTMDLALAVTAAGALVSPIYAYAPYPGTRLADAWTEKNRPTLTDAQLTDVSWNVSRAPWVDRRLARRLAVLYAASLFIDDKLTLYRSGWGSRLLLAVLRPLARLRLRRRWLNWGWERRALRLLLGRHF